MKRRLLRLACAWGAWCSILAPVLLLGSGSEGAPASLIKRVAIGTEGHRPTAIAFDRSGELAIVTAPFGGLFTRDGKTLGRRKGVFYFGKSPPISPISLVVAPDGTLYTSGYGQQIARSLPGKEGHLGRFELWLERAELGSVVPLGLALDSSGDLFATDMSDALGGKQGVVRIDRQTGAVEVVVPRGGGGLQSARALAFDAQDRLYVADRMASAVLRFDRETGELDRVVVLPSRAQGSEYIDLEFGPDGLLYILDSGRGEVLRFDVETAGAPEVLVDLSAQTTAKAIEMAVAPSGEVVVLTGGSELLLYATGTPSVEPGSRQAASEAPRPAPAPGPTAPIPRSPEPPLAPPVTTVRPATTTSQRLYLRIQPAAPDGYRSADRGILLREIYRQGFALAAIDVIGALVRDQGLGEAPPTGALDLVASVLALPGERVRLSLAAAAAPSVPRWSRDLPAGDGDRIDYLDAVADVERLARERWPEVLETLGLERFEAQPEPAGAQASPTRSPPEPEDLDLLTQLIRVRQAHRRLALAEAESLQELALGYANLVFLTDFQWSAASESLMARSLLYAERLVVGHPSPAALRVRAYARALAGFHAAALSDLAAVDSGPTGEIAATGWQGVIEAYCRSDFERLTRIATESEGVADLAGRLAFRVIADSGSPVLVGRTAEAVLARNPRAWEVYAGMSRAEGFGLKASGSVALTRNTAELGERLLSTPELPASVRPPDESSGLNDMLGSLMRWWSEVVAGDTSEASPSVAVEIARQLEALGEAAVDDDGQPSWQALAHLLGETLFAQIERLVSFESFQRSVDVSTLLEFFRPLWRDHPLSGLVEGYGLDPRRDRELLVRLISDLEIARPRPELESLFEQIELVGDQSIATELQSTLWLHPSALDETADDLRILLTRATNRETAHRLLAVSPDSPAALAVLIREDWKSVEGRAREWQTELAAHPQITRALADRYRRLEQFEEAAAVLRRYVRKVPDSWAYTELASIHSETGNVDEWRRGMEDFLSTTDDEGLAHARARVRLARHYNLRGEFSKARPYADLAARSWAEWAMNTAAWTHEGLGNWQRAEDLREAVSERYESARMDWYFWCRRTGRGDLDAARRLAESAIPDRRAGGASRVEVGIFLLLEGELEAAEREFRTVFESTGNPQAGLHLAFTLFDLARPEASEVLEQVSERGPVYAKAERRLGELLELTSPSRRLLAGELTLAAHGMIIDGILSSLGGGWRANAEYFVGRFLESAGAEAEAKESLERSAEAYHYGMWNSTLAAVRLRQLD